MSSGKSTRALNAALRLKRLGRTVVLLRPPSAQRGRDQSGLLRTKDGAEFRALEPPMISAIKDLEAGAIWLDEPFAWPDADRLPDVLPPLMEEADILVSTISATSEGGPIHPSVSWLMAVADHVYTCYADCDGCGRLEVATRSWFVGGEKAGAIHIGDSYISLCPECWNSEAERYNAKLLFSTDLG
jgi:thymidine kinase